MRKVVVSLMVLGLSSVGFAQFPLLESEPNNSFATAQFIPPATHPFGGVAVDGAVPPGDVDYFSVDLAAGDIITAATYDFDPTGSGGSDTVLGLFRPDGSLMASSDDDGPGFLSALYRQADASGRWRVAVSGFPDFSFVGEHGEDIRYKLVLGFNPIPEPATLSLLALGALAVLRRR
jgi:hypothetical protein